MLRTTKLTTSLTAIICLMMVFTAPTTAQECGEYEVTVIAGFSCPPFGLAAVLPQAISESGIVVGYVSCGFTADAFYWTPEAGLQVIPMPDGTSESKALAISGSKIVGTYDNSQLELGKAGFLYDSEIDEFTSLHTLPGGDWSEAHDINSKGEIVGFWGNTVQGPSPQAFIWRDGEMIDINPDFGTNKSEANGITNAGLVTGWMGTSKTTDARAYIWTEGKVTELPPIPGGFTSEGKGIDCANRVVGCGRREEGNPPQTMTRAFLWQDGEMTYLGTLPGFMRSAALGIRSTPLQIVGQLWSGSQDDTDSGFIWQDGVMSDVQDLLPSNSGIDLSDAVSINQNGQILSRAHSDPLDATVGVVLTPVHGSLGDLNGDCLTNVSDLLILLANWGPCEVCLPCTSDLDGNEIINVSDLLMLFANWG